MMGKNIILYSFIAIAFGLGFSRIWWSTALQVPNLMTTPTSKEEDLMMNSPFHSMGPIVEHFESKTTNTKPFDDEEKNQQPLVHHHRLSKPIHNTTPPKKGTSTISSPSALSNNSTTAHPCSYYDGLLHIAGGDAGAAAGTAFFQYTLNQLYYASLYNLLPVIWYDGNQSPHIYDFSVHSKGRGWNMTTTTGIWNATDIYNQTYPQNPPWPGPPENLSNLTAKNSTIISLYFSGNGIWESYFEPLNTGYDPNHPSCQALPYIRLTMEQLNPKINFYAPWAMRSWNYKRQPEGIKKNINDTFQTWFKPQRQRAWTLIEKLYSIKLKKDLLPENISQEDCLGIHIRHSDKSGKNRRRVEPNEFIPYIAEYLRNLPNGKIFVATDSDAVLGSLQRRWRRNDNITHSFNETVVYDSTMLRSNTKIPTFKATGDSKDRTNREVLRDIYRLASCQYMLHGLSAVSEAAHYLSWPDLHHQSVNLEDPDRLSVIDFGKLIKETTQ
mmetsp:Transcript_1332/g.1737  ORF Transcript_1332/g.1737 Transcript_1332/m.1737 type:complete len:497 (-) Transcript_1332:198-1688(-)